MPIGELSDSLVSIRRFAPLHTALCLPGKPGRIGADAIIKRHPFGVSFLLISDFLSSQAVSSQVLSAFTSLTTVFGMGTGEPRSYRH